MSEKREGEKSSGYRRAFGGKNVSAQEFKSNVAELKDAVFTINPNQADAAKFEKSIEAISNYVVRNYDGGILLAKGMREGKLPVVVLPVAPLPRKRRKKKKKKKKKRRKKKKKKKKKRPKVKVKTEETPKVVVTTDIAVESSVQPKQGESKDADNEAHTDPDGGKEDGSDSDD